MPLDGGNVPEALSIRLQFAAVDECPADVTVARQWQHVNHTEENKVRPLDLQVNNIEIDFTSIRLRVYVVRYEFWLNVYVCQQMADRMQYVSLACIKSAWLRQRLRLLRHGASAILS